MPDPSHRDAILDQFTRQAVPFSTAAGIKDEQALRLWWSPRAPGPTDTVLDVACGGGLVVCAFARVVASRDGHRPHAGDDRARARASQQEQGLTNVSVAAGRRAAAAVRRRVASPS